MHVHIVQKVHALLSASTCPLKSQCVRAFRINLYFMATPSILLDNAAHPSYIYAYIQAGWKSFLTQNKMVNSITTSICKDVADLHERLHYTCIHASATRMKYLSPTYWFGESNVIPSAVINYTLSHNSTK